jgi:hypothetical protein
MFSIRMRRYTMTRNTEIAQDTETVTEIKRH